jgi:hypothetical protein
MSSPAADIRDYLTGEVGGTIFANHEPDLPANCVTIYNTGGLPGDVDNDFYRPTIQIRVRCLEPEAGFALMEQLMLALALPVSFTENGWRYIGAGSTTEPEAIGRDDKQRFLIVQNFQIMREHATT